jgi:hypothetical protein
MTSDNRNIKDYTMDILLLVAYMASGFAVMAVIKNFRSKKDL